MPCRSRAKAGAEALIPCHSAPDGTPFKPGEVEFLKASTGVEVRPAAMRKAPPTLVPSRPRPRNRSCPIFIRLYLSLCVYLQRRACPATPTGLRAPEVIYFATSPGIGPQTLSLEAQATIPVVPNSPLPTSHFRRGPLSPFHFPRFGAPLRDLPSWAARMHSFQPARCPSRATAHMHAPSPHDAHGLPC